MSEDGYVLVRRSTIAWLLEAYRALPDDLKPQVTTTVVEDLRAEVLSQVQAPEPDEERLRSAGPLLSVEQHIEIITEDPNLNLPTGQAGEFWRLVVRVVHAFQSNEAEAVMTLLKRR